MEVEDPTDPKNYQNNLSHSKSIIVSASRSPLGPFLIRRLVETRHTGSGGKLAFASCSINLLFEYFLVQKASVGYGGFRAP